MSDINSVSIIGRLVKDAVASRTGSGTAVVSFSIASNRRKKEGEAWVDDVGFFDVTVYGKQGESIRSYLVKGRSVGILGELRQERWTGADGNQKSKVAIVAQHVQLLAPKERSDVNW